jgi:heat shock protein HtpX
LRKIDTYAERAAVPDVERHPATAHLFIVNPLRSANLADLFATHPSTEQRVRRLEAMAAAQGMGAWEQGAREAGPWGARRPV